MSDYIGQYNPCTAYARPMPPPQCCLWWKGPTDLVTIPKYFPTMILPIALLFHPNWAWIFFGSLHILVPIQLTTLRVAFPSCSSIIALARVYWHLVLCRMFFPPPHTFSHLFSSLADHLAHKMYGFSTEVAWGRGWGRRTSYGTQFGFETKYCDHGGPQYLHVFVHNRWILYYSTSTARGTNSRNKSRFNMHSIFPLLRSQDMRLDYEKGLLSTDRGFERKR